MSFEIGQRILLPGKNRATVDEMERNGQIKHATLDSGAGWYRPAKVKRLDVLPSKMPKAAL